MAGSSDQLHGTLRGTLAHHQVPAFFPEDVEYTELVKPYNLLYPYKPAVICVPDNTHQVGFAVRSAANLGFKVQARSGGHSYGGYSLGGRDDSMVVCLRHFQDVELTDDIARVGAGARIGLLAEKLYTLGRRAVPHGTEKTVGVGGHFSHGGYGYQSRAWGLALDTIVAMDVVLADGEMIHVTAAERPDLFYACRGAADSFGIIVCFYLKTVPAPESVIVFRYNIPDLVPNVTDAVSAVLYIQAMARRKDFVTPDISFGLVIRDGVLQLQGVYLGDDMDKLLNVTSILLQTVPEENMTAEVLSLGWLESVNWFSSQPNDPSEGSFDTFYASSAVVSEHKPLDERLLTGFFEEINSHKLDPSQSWYSIINLHGGPGSKINEVPSHASAYAHRDNLWVVQNVGCSLSHQPPLYLHTINFINRLTARLEPVGAEPNYLCPSATRDDAHRLHYGILATAGLKVIKDKVDRGNVFWNPHSIRAVKFTQLGMQ